MLALWLGGRRAGNSDARAQKALENTLMRKVLAAK